MNEQKSLLLEIAEAIDHRLRRRGPQEEGAQPVKIRPRWLRWLARQMVPNIGTLLMVVVLLLTIPSLAAPLLAPSATSTSTISYQGRLADSGGNPLTGKYNLEFRIYDVPTGGTPLWTEMWTGANAVDVSDGLFNVMLGSIDNTLASAIEGYDELYLGITVGTDSEMEPRVQLGSVPFSMQALTVPDGSIGTEKIVDGAVTQAKLGADIHLLHTIIETAELAGTFDSSASAWVDVPDLSIQVSLLTTSTVFVNLQYREQKNHDTEYYKVHILRDGIEVYFSDTHFRHTGIHNHRNIAFFDTDVPAETHTYQVQIHPRGHQTALCAPYTQLGAIAFFND